MILKAALGVGAACALVAGTAVAGSAAHSAPGATVALTTAGTSATSSAAARVAAAPVAAQAAAAADDVAGVTGAAATRRRRCERLPERIQRTQKLEQVLAGSATTKGSIAYLQARISAAKTAHHDELAATLTRRLEFRTALQGFLPQRLDLLRTASTTVCAPGSTGTAS